MISAPKPRGRRKQLMSARDTTAVLAAQGGQTSDEIAATLGVCGGTMLCLLTRARAAGVSIPFHKRGPKGPIGWRDSLAA
jgi:hypothetical protein